MMDDQNNFDADLNAALDRYDAVAPTLATTSLDKNPEHGARALEISKATGAPPEAIFDDLEAYDNELKAGLTHQIVSNNFEIAKYLRENPLADVVSNDDYGNMEKFSQKVPGSGFVDRVISGLEKTPAGRFLIVPAGAGLVGAGKGVVEAVTAPPTAEEVAEFEKAGPVERFGYGGYDIAKKVLGVLGGSIAGGVSETAGKFAEELGADVSGIERAKRDALGMLEDAMGRASHIMPDRIAEKAVAEADAARAAKPWADSNIEPPTGVHPDIDAVKTDVNAQVVEAIYENHAAALEMLTRERSPEHAEAFIKQFYGSSSIGISGDRIAELYGDSVPQAGDGLLGWVPDLEQKLADAVSTGGDVQIPLTEWLAKVDPEVANGLKPFVRVWGGGITEAEAGIKVEPTPIVEAPIAQARAAMGTEPIFGLGDRKLTVQKIEGEVAETPESLQILDHTGTPAGDITIVPEGETLRIQSITGEVGADIETIGPSALVDVVKQIKEAYPEAKEVVIGEDAIPLDTTKPLTVETYNKTKYALSRIYDEKLVSEVIPDAEFDLPETTARDQLAQVEPTRAGLTKKSWGNLRKLLLERHDRDVRAALERAERIERKTQTKEWKAAAEEVRKSVAEKIGNRPDVLADLMVGGGEIGGEKQKQRFPLREDSLTAEQKAGLPKHYYSKEGLVPDQIAGMFGYPTGDAMVNDLMAYNRSKGDLSSRAHLAKIIEEETVNAMNWMRGKLDENIMRDAVDHALSETDLNLIAEEWQGAAMQAGEEMISKELVKTEALEAFGRMKTSDVSFVRLQDQALKFYRAAVDALNAGDAAGALVALERRYRVSLQMAEAKKFEKQQTKFNKTAKQFSKRDVPSVEHEYTNWIHDVLMRVGKPVKRSVEDLRKEIEATGTPKFEDFVNEKASALREVAVWDELFDPTWTKNIEDMTVEEFRNVADSIKSLVWNGRDERKIYKQGEAADLELVVASAIDNIAKSAKDEIQKPIENRLQRTVKNYYVGSLQAENVLNRWDAFNPRGIWNQYFMRDLVDGANQVDAWKKEYGKKIQELSVPDNIRNSLDNPLFFDQDTGIKLKFTRKNLIAIMLNMGTGVGKKSNLRKLADGYKLEPQQITDWVNEHATAEDWKLVREMWDIFADIKTKSDTMYRSISGGIPAENMPAVPVQTPFGEIAGGYFPIIHHSEMEGTSKKLMGAKALEQQGYFRAAPPAGYTKTRTGYSAPLALDFDQLPARIAQMLQDVGMRPAYINASKLLYNHDVRSAIRKHYGVEYRDMLHNYLKSVVNSADNMSMMQRDLGYWSEFIRQNLITTLVGLNPGTVLKHGPSALVTSIREVGPKRFLDAAHSLHRINEETGQSNWEFAISNSLELQRRDRNWEETLYGAAGGALSPGDKFGPWRQKIIEWSSKPVALSDMLSAVPTWMAEYTKQMEAGESHGDSVYMADRAVRRAHGSTAPTNRTALMRESSPWLTSVYNFFSDIMNRQMETIWKSGETFDLAKQGDHKAAMLSAGAFTASLFAYAVWPAIVEHLVSGEAADPKESWGVTASKAGLRTAASSWVGVRDFANWMLYGNDPQFGMMGTAMKEAGALFNDLAKDHPLRKDHAGRLLQDGAGLIGLSLGTMPQQLGRTARFIHDANSGIEHPKGPWGWAVGLRFGTTKHHSETWEDYLKGKVRK